MALLALSCSKKNVAEANDPASGASSVKVEIRIQDSGNDFATEISHTIHVSEMVSIEVQITPPLLRGFQA